MNELALFAGAGGGILGGYLCGFQTVCAVEIEEYPRKVLLQRQEDGMLPYFPIWDDICTFDGLPWQGKIDVITGGFPCQDISAAGKGKGLAGARSGLVFEMLRVVEEVQPRFVFAENSPLLRTRGLGEILYQLDHLGYDAKWCVLGAWHVGASHKRNRMWLLAHSNKFGRRCQRPLHCQISETIKEKRFSNEIDIRPILERLPIVSYPDDLRISDDLAEKMDQIKAIGNGQVPAVAALAWEILSEGGMR